MSTTLDEPRLHSPAASAAEHLRTTTAAVRLSFTWLGTRKTLSRQQKDQAAESFGAQGDFLSAGKKLLDTRHPAFKAVTSAKNKLVSLWKAMSLPYPEPGVRLIRQDDVELFNQRMQLLCEELEEAVWRLDEHFEELKATARERLGRLYSPADYPDSLQGLFSVQWDFPSVEPPDYLRRLKPELYEQECQRVASRFDEAVQLAEQAFVEELEALVAHLTERLTGQADGKCKVFRDSAIENLSEFFDRFRRLNIRSSEELDRLVDDCRRIVRGVAPQQLRENSSLRESVARELGQVQSVLDQLLVDRPRRNILRRPR
jgi:hypothetical protein